MPDLHSSKTPDAAPEQREQSHGDASAAGASAPRPKCFLPWLTIVLRVLTGALFVLSGWAKAVDPWGSVFKIEEYFAAWGWYDFPHSLITVGAFLLGSYEFVCGALLMLGCYRRGSVTALSLLMMLMLPLSLYIAIENPVSDCGCFGDAFVISNTATFVKNVVICAALAYLLPFNKRVTTFVTTYAQWIVGGVLTLYILLIGLIGYNIQPLEDFRRFAPGTSLTGDNDDDDAEEATSQMTFIYERDGEQRQFTLDNLPDSTWTFVDRLDGPDASASADLLTITDPETGEDLTEEVLSTPGGPDLMLVTVPDIADVDLSATYLLNDLDDFVKARDGKLVMLAGVNATAADLDAWHDVSMSHYPIYRLDAKTIKELARGTSALVYVRDGEVVWKRTLNSIAYSTVTDTPADQLLEMLDPQPVKMLNYLTWATVVILAAVIMLDRTGHLVHIHLRRRRRARSEVKES